eukprot:GHVS01085704.1.p1 GENE.GHVS01085704.1~~GHVS01085704.1.p1  ORF type:complete len:169 (-),score=39.14 GHVS01085704.1:48-554(-)
MPAILGHVTRAAQISADVVHLINKAMICFAQELLSVADFVRSSHSSRATLTTDDIAVAVRRGGLKYKFLQCCLSDILADPNLQSLKHIQLASQLNAQQTSQLNATQQEEEEEVEATNRPAAVRNPTKTTRAQHGTQRSKKRGGSRKQQMSGGNVSIENFFKPVNNNTQ